MTSPPTAAGAAPADTRPLRPPAAVRAVDAVFPLLPVALVALGVGLRIASYLANPTLSTDEAALALNVMHRSFSELFDQLDFNQGAPVGFLVVQKTLLEFGSSEYVLRLFPLAGAIAALLLFYPVAKRILDRRASLLALALFAVSEPLLFYASTAKQYSIDVAVTLALYALALSWVRSVDWGRTALFGLAAGVAVWLSHAGVFVVAGIVFVRALEAIVERNWRRLLILLGVAAAWLASLGVVYVAALHELASLQETFARGRGFVAAETEGGLVRVLASAARYLLGVPQNSAGAGLPEVIGVLAILLVLLGFVVLLRARWTSALLLAAPAGFTLVASALGKYPLFPRALLFLTPALVMLVAAGGHFLATRPVGVFRILGVGTSTAILVAAGVTSVQHLSSAGDDVKVMLRHLALNQERRDSLYVFNPLQYTFRYYLECGCFGHDAAVRRGLALWPLKPARGGPGQSDPALQSVPPLFLVGAVSSSDSDLYAADLARLRGRERVWLLVGASAPAELEALLASADRAGARLGSESLQPGDGPTGVYLYDFSRDS